MNVECISFKNVNDLSFGFLIYLQKSYFMLIKNDLYPLPYRMGSKLICSFINFLKSCF